MNVQREMLLKAMFAYVGDNITELYGHLRSTRWWQWHRRAKLRGELRAMQNMFRTLVVLGQGDNPNRE